MADRWLVVLSRSAEREVESLDDDNRNRVTAALDRLADGDVQTSLKRLDGDGEPTFSLGVGDFAVLLDRELGARTLRVLAVRPRATT